MMDGKRLRDMWCSKPCGHWNPLCHPNHTQDMAASVVPKKPNWDLRREVAPKLERLERRTQRAMVQLLQQEERARLEQEGGVGD